MGTSVPSAFSLEDYIERLYDPLGWLCGSHTVGHCQGLLNSMGLTWNNTEESLTPCFLEYIAMGIRLQYEEVGIGLQCEMCKELMCTCEVASIKDKKGNKQNKLLLFDILIRILW